MLSSHDLPAPGSPLDKSHSDHGLDSQSPATIDVTADVIRTPSHSLPAVAFCSMSEPVTQLRNHPQHQHSRTGSLQGQVPVQADGRPDDVSTTAAANGSGFVDVDDVAMHVDRDPNHWHDMVRIKFDDIFGEPEPEVFSKDNIWTTSIKVFSSSKYWCYRILSMAFVVPLAVWWGSYFACTVFCRVWCCVPCLKACDIQLHCVRRLVETLLRSLVAPFYEAVGRCFYHIRVRLIKASDDNP